MVNADNLSPGYRQQGVVILETMVAILIFSLAVLALVGLQASMIKNTSDAKYRADASFLAQNKIAERWGDSTKLAAGESGVTNELPGGRFSVSIPVNGQFTVRVGWTLPGEAVPANDTTAPCFMRVAHCYTAFASVAGG